jgi:hypothetical protein
MFRRDRWKLKLVTPASFEVELPADYATGNSEDDQVMRQIALRGPLDQPRHWVHFLPCQDHAAAIAVAQAALEAGWTVEISADRKGRDWCVTAELSDVVTTGERVRQAREFFSDLAGRVPGADYDGWHASV